MPVTLDTVSVAATRAVATSTSRLPAATAPALFPVVHVVLLAVSEAFPVESATSAGVPIAAATSARVAVRQLAGTRHHGERATVTSRRGGGVHSPGMVTAALDTAHEMVTVHVILSVSLAPLLIAVNVARASMVPALAALKIPASAIAAFVASPAAQSPT